MCQMKYLFEYCDMKKAFELAKVEQREDFCYGYIPNEPLFDLAERIALKNKNNGEYPIIWPWMINSL